MRLTVLASGSSGNCAIVDAGDARIMIDAGISPKECKRRLRSVNQTMGRVSKILVTHAHVDHAGFLLSMIQATGAEAIGPRGAVAGAGEYARPIEPGEAFAPDGVGYMAIEVPHDAQCFGYVLSTPNASLAVLLDLGHIPPMLAWSIRDVDALMLDCNYSEELLPLSAYNRELKARIQSNYGHLSNEQVARFLRTDLGPRCNTVILAHLSDVNNTPAFAELAARTALTGRDVEIVVADTATRSTVIEVKGA